MAYADPQNIVSKSLPRTSSEVNAGEFRNADSDTMLRVSHQYGRRNRRLVKLTSNKIAPDPFTGVNTAFSASVQLVLDVPPVGFTLAEQTALIAGLSTWLTAATNANATKFIGGES